MDQDHYLLKMALGYLFTIAIEAPILVLLLSRRHAVRHRLFAGVWLTACTYPVVWLVIPRFVDPGHQRGLYLAVAETFAPAAECILFWFAFGTTEPRSRWSTARDLASILVANLASFGLGELFHQVVGWEWLDF